MKRVLLPITLAVVLMGIDSANAATCGDEGVAEVGHLTIDPHNADLVAGLGVSLLLGLNPDTFPANDIRNNRNPCHRGSFTVSGVRIEVFGDNNDLPPRWAIGPNTARIAFLALVPDPLEALAWARSRAADDTSAQFSRPPYYVLAVTDGHRRQIYQIFTAIPADDLLAAAMRDAIEGTQAALAVFDEETGNVTITGQ